MRILYIPKPVSSFYPIKYGALYNWWAATDAKKITSSDDWVVPTSTQRGTLITYLGGTTVAGGKLKETGTVYWDSPNTGATNEVGFNGRGSGSRLPLGGFNSDIKKTIWIWCSNTFLSDGNKFQFSYDTDDAVLGFAPKGSGFSIRSLYVGAGTPTEYVGNDGKRYPVVQIGTQYWISMNLAETKFRDGSTIPIVTDNTAWAALTTAGMCYYDNDESTYK